MGSSPRFAVVLETPASAAWRKEIPEGAVVTIGSAKDATLSVPAQDPLFKPVHAILDPKLDSVRVICLRGASIRFGSGEMREAALRPGERFSIGALVFRIASANEASTSEIPVEHPSEEQPTEELSLDELQELPSKPTKRSSVAPSSTLGPFELLDELGRGGFGVVYRARWKETGALCALKLLIPSEKLTEDQLQRFERERLIQQELHHPNIVRVLHAGSVGSIRFIATELIAGGNLDKHTPCIDQRQAWRIAADLFAALGYAHQRRIVHRDVKPANVLLSEPSTGGLRRGYLTDFGMAKAFNAAMKTQIAPGLTVQGNVGGTLRMMAPEQLKAFQEFQPVADVYSAAVTIYSFLTNRSPIELSRSWEELKLVDRINAVMHGRRIPIVELRPELKGTLAERLDALVATDPSAREATNARALASLFEGGL